MERAAAPRGPPAFLPRGALSRPESRPAADAFSTPPLDEARGRASPQQMPPQAPRDGEGQGRAGSGAGARPGGGRGGSSCRAARGGRSPRNAAAGSRGRQGSSCALYFSSSSDDEFEMFLTRMKTPKAVSKKVETSLKDFIDDSDDFFLDFQVRKGARESTRKDLQTPKQHLMTSGKKTTCCPELQYSEALSDTEDSVFVECSGPGYQKGRAEDSKENWGYMKLPRPGDVKEAVSRGSPDLPGRREERSCGKSTGSQVPAAALRQSAAAESCGSEEEFESLIERVRKRSIPQRPVLSTSKAGYQPSTTENIKPPCEGAQPVKGKGVTTPRPNSVSLQETPSRIMTSERIPRKELLSCSQSAKTEKRLRVCSVPGCFLQDLSNPDSHYVKHFKKNKEELAQKLYCLYNTTIFEQKLPEQMAIIWNKKMRKTAGYCVTGQSKAPEAQRYARIELSERVCDSADRLRDTLLHEACHAASWLINGVRDGHGPFWKFYAHKSAVIHPELPAVTRCHSYEINYKFTYQCVNCKAKTGRHSKSLDTERFVCAFCGGQLLLRQPPRKGDTPARTPLTPFAKYVKENYGLAKREQRGLSHGEVMKKLSADFALKTKLQDSL